MYEIVLLDSLTIDLASLQKEAILFVFGFFIGPSEVHALPLGVAAKCSVLSFLM